MYFWTSIYWVENGTKKHSLFIYEYPVKVSKSAQIFIDSGDYKMPSQTIINWKCVGF